MDRLAAIAILADKAINEGWTWGDPVNIEGWDYTYSDVGEVIANTFHNPIHKLEVSGFTLDELKPNPQGQGWEDKGEREHDAYPTDERQAEVTELARDMFLQAVGSGGDLQEIKKINFLILADGFYNQVDKHFKG